MAVSLLLIVELIPCVVPEGDDNGLASPEDLAGAVVDLERTRPPFWLLEDFRFRFWFSRDLRRLLLRAAFGTGERPVVEGGTLGGIVSTGSGGGFND